ncbi:D-Ala-D-Ala carboxypeptidase family metallohydrolase [Ruegeria sp. Ofav3-42]|uniref:D-Ala-D-Ala carboxypeptidase family metallohydrolase n=1 Tax=Ruegeria sp. Ofav3-42 TaxID=2917759 RepID=UPI001EF433D4|nr:D-Ala-D-Ala carboxypeptidase family metallohydrolase [Ruegeria sp. Ofav3-42]MCG7519507.1 D-Ala-D-Ala carboxypeptidase family metallohydrolase [Ruegeria sp. Ofav3-42]
MNDLFEGNEYDFVEGDMLQEALRGDYSRSDTPEMVEFRAFFDTLPSEFFTADEFMILGPSNRPGGSCEGKNGLAPKSLWNNVKPLVKAMNLIRKELGASVQITNCFRSGTYNACVGGVPGSFHSRFQAADWICGAGNSAMLASAARAVRDAGGFSGGIGIYNSFVHVDVRGSNADWDNRS